MSDVPTLDRETVKRAFIHMGEFLRDRKVIGEIAVYGGAALMLQFQWRRSTRDVDAVITVGEHSLVQKAAWDAAKALRLPPSWLNEAVSVYTSRNEKDTDLLPMGTFPSYERPGLRVMTASPRYLLAMKVIAMERVTADDRDFNDAADLATEIGVRDESEVREILLEYFGPSRIPETVSRQIPRMIVEASKRGNKT